MRKLKSELRVWNTT